MNAKGGHPGVDNYINQLPGWQKEICTRVRRLILNSTPEIEETIKRRVQPYFICNGNVAALLATKDHVNVFIYDPIVPDPENIINQGQNNATARSIQIYKDDSLNEKAFVKLIQSVVANNKAGGWRKIQAG